MLEFWMLVASAFSTDASETVFPAKRMTPGWKNNINKDKDSVIFYSIVALYPSTNIMDSSLVFLKIGISLPRFFQTPNT